MGGLRLQDGIVSYFEKEQTDSEFSFRFSDQVGKDLKKLLLGDKELRWDDASKLNRQDFKELLDMYNEMVEINHKLDDGERTQNGYCYLEDKGYKGHKTKTLCDKAGNCRWIPGSGNQPGESQALCSVCGGSGESRTCSRKLDNDPNPHRTEEDCDYSGECQWIEDGGECTLCDGTGK